MKKIYALFFATSLFLSANMTNAQNQASYNRIYDPTVPLAVLSENGEWASGEFQSVTFTYNTVTDESSLVTQPGDVINILSGVSNDGLFVGAYGSDYGTAAPYTFKNGIWTELETLEGQPIGLAKAITADSKLIVGNNGKDIGCFVPVIWRLEGGTYKVERLPSPEKDMLGMIPQGTIALDITEDGSVIIGRFTDYTSYYEQPIKWELQPDNTYSYELLGSEVLYNLDKPNPGAMPIFEDWVTAAEGTPQYKEQYDIWKAERDEFNKKMSEFKTPVAFGRAYRLNSDGTRVLGVLEESDKLDESGEEIVVPYCLDIKSGKKIKYPQSAYACAITNSGRVIYSTPFGGICNVAYITSDDENLEGVLLNEWLKNTYDLDIDQDQTIMSGGEEKIITGSITLSKNEKVLIGHFWDDGLGSYSNYVVKLPEPISPSSIQNNESVPSLEVFARGNTVRIDGEVCSVEVSDIAGKSVYRSRNNHSIASLLPGIYVVKAVAANGSTVVKKIMIGK